MSGSARDSMAHFASDIAAIETRPVPASAHRRELLDQISNFLLDHALDVNPFNLSLAQEVVSGRNPELGRRIAERQLAKAPVTQDWLRELASDVAHNSAFAAVLDREHCAARAAGKPLSIALCDIDQFTAINASHGRDTGDRLLQAVARVLQRISDENCHVAGHGGADFAVLFPGLTPDQAAVQLDRARDNFAQRKLVDRKTHMTIGNVTFSGGVTDVLAHDELQSALNVAEQALQAAKEQGRNRIVINNHG